MKKPEGLKTKIFIDSGDPEETAKIIHTIGFLDGQTTNPSLVAKNPAIASRIAKGEKLKTKEALDFYKKIVQEIALLMPKGSVSIEVIADNNTSSSQMVEQGRGMFTWIPSAHVKLPTTQDGLEAAEILLAEGVRINFTLCFTQAQAAAIFQISKNILPGQVYVSPFIGRLDDRGENGMDLVRNIIRMKKDTGSMVEVLAASIRNLDELYESLYLESDIATVPFKILNEWKENGLKVPTTDYVYPSGSLKEIPYQDFDLAVSWVNYNINDPLTEKGIDKFTADWNSFTRE